MVEVGPDDEDEAEGFWKTGVGEEAEDGLWEALLIQWGGGAVESELPQRQWGVGACGVRGVTGKGRAGCLEEGRESHEWHGVKEG